MSSYNPYQPIWDPYRHNQGGSGGAHGHGETEDVSGHHGTHQDDLYQMGVPQEGPLPYHGQGYPSYTAPSYNVTSADMQYMMQAIIRLESQMDNISQLMTQYNELLQSMHDQEDTKCVQGSGGGAIIVRM
ncbi:hypothetical protein [Halobacillus naozhouensis]|uniref:Uncharacterized protein n=1 Tax=Halobacillus naozhouensis TaxID=554880 RepID=A0ABY8J074_9BACI|nr:hypothetical protein [Halobacillus naozhouensis]WFT75466.1 hypothetical protein P9989_03440 [Halobacillus naozhouensis]